VLEWIDGPDLSRLLQASTPPISQAVSWVIQAAEAVEHAHQRRVVHCDLKPGNLLLRPDGAIVVSDFGLARSLSVDASAAAPWEGTASFMAPEQIDCSFGSVSATTDVYGLGAVLYTLLTGHPPYQGTRAIDVIAQILSASEPPSLNNLQRLIPPTIVEVCQRCLATAPCDRFPTAQALADELRRHPEIVLG
jgi:serine/threonine protein kinase